MTRRLFGFFIGSVGTVALLWFVPTPFYVTAPGAALDTSRLISVRGGEAHHDRLLGLIVTTRPANLLLYLYAKLDPNRVSLETPRQFLGSIPNYEQFVLLARRDMEDAQATARAVALQQLGLGKGAVPAGAEVTGFTPGSPSKHRLQEGDVIVRAADRVVTNRADLTGLVQSLKPGAPVTLRVRRGEGEIDLTIVTAEHPDVKGKAALGLFLRDFLQFDLPVPVEIHAGPITGPSVGLIFTLQIMDQLTPGGLTGGLRVAATGTIAADGRVGPIGGVVQKVFSAEAAGADVFFVPQENYDDALGAATRIRVVSVGHVTEALAWLKAQRKG